MILSMYIGSHRIATLSKKITSGLIFGFVVSTLSLYSLVISRWLVTDSFAVLPENIPTITLSFYLFVMAISASFCMQIIVIFWPELPKDKKLKNKIPFITYLVIFISLALPAQLILFNGVAILNTTVEKTYIADTLPYFKCTKEFYKEIPDKSSRYIKIDENEYRVISIIDNKIDIQTAICNGNKVKFIEI